MPNEHLRGVFGLFSPYNNLLKDNPMSFTYYMGIITLIWWGTVVFNCYRIILQSFGWGPNMCKQGKGSKRSSLLWQPVGKCSQNRMAWPGQGIPWKSPGILVTRTSGGLKHLPRRPDNTVNGSNYNGDGLGRSLESIIGTFCQGLIWQPDKAWPGESNGDRLWTNV